MLFRSPFLMHESTRDVAKKHTSGLLGLGKDDPTWQGYVTGIREQFNAAPPDPSKPYLGGKYASFNEYKTAGLQAPDLLGVYGNLNTFGPEWAHLTPEQQTKVTQGIINAGLYDSKKGEVIITDPDAARKIKDDVVGGKVNPTGGLVAVGQNEPARVITGTPTTPISSGPGLVLKRSSTQSPGIGLDGRPINAVNAQRQRAFGGLLNT